MCTFRGGLLQEFWRSLLCPLKLEPRVFASWQCPLQQSCPIPFLPVSSPRAVPCTFCGAKQGGEKYSTSLNSSAHQRGELSRCLGSTGGRVQPLHKPAHRAAAKLGATPNWACGLCSWVGIPAQKYEFPSKVVNSKFKMCAVPVLTVWLLTVLRDVCSYPYFWIKA